MKKEYTIYDIANELKLSPATVSRGLKDHPAISEGTKKRIVEYAQKVGYQANKFATALRKQQTNTIGVIVPKLDSQFMSSALAGMEKVANLAGYNLIISQSLEMASKEKRNAEIMFDSRVDGLIVSLAFDTVDTSHFKPFIKKGIPVILFDRIDNELPVPSIVIDNFEAGYQATKHLIEQGCKKIVHVTGNTLRNVYHDRLEGYKKAIHDAGVFWDESLVLHTRLDIQAGVDAADTVLAMKPMPDGIFVANDLCASIVIKNLKLRGIKIPEQIAIVGFNNDPIANIVEPNLTSIDYPSRLMGETAVKQLLELLPGRLKTSSQSKTLIESELIVRQSSLKKSGNN